MKARWIAAAVALVLSSAAGAFAGNPAYDSWASHKPGTCLTTKSTTQAPGIKAQTEDTYTLKEVTPEKVTLEHKASMTVGQNKKDMPDTTMEILSAGPAPTTPGDAKTSQETLTIDGKEYKATCTTENQPEDDGNISTTKTWTSPDMPGLTCKLDYSKEAIGQSMKVEVTKVELK